jgi:hypothetical protein
MLKQNTWGSSKITKKHGRCGIGRRDYPVFQEVCMANQNASLSGVYAPSDDIVARDIEGELIIVPLVSGIGDMEDELYTMNETAKIIWDQLNGKQSLKEIVRRLSPEYKSAGNEIEKDVIGLVNELLKRKLITEILS